MKTSGFLKWFLAGGMLLLGLACLPVSELISGSQPAGTDATTIPAESDEELVTRIDSWVAAIGSLRSVELELVTAIPGREPRTLTVRIDSAGNSHLILHLSHPPEFFELEEGFSPGNFELFIVDEAAYTRMSSEAAVVADDSYRSLLMDTLLGPQGPGLWLNLVPQDEIVSAGDESYEEFAAEKYVVDGQVEQGFVRGTVWVEDQIGALVGAQLDVSGILFFPPGSTEGGDVSITLTVHQADVPAINLP